MSEQVTLDEVIAGVEPLRRKSIDVVRKCTGEVKTLGLVAKEKGYIVLNWSLAGHVKFRAKSGEGVGVVRGWFIPKRFLIEIEELESC